MMDILTGRKPSSTASGNVRMNGHVISDSMTRRYLSYIAQVSQYKHIQTAANKLRVHPSAGQLQLGPSIACKLLLGAASELSFLPHN